MSVEEERQIIPKPASIRFLKKKMFARHTITKLVVSGNTQQFMSSENQTFAKG